LTVYLIQFFIYKKYIFKDLEYSVSLSRNEAFEGEELYLYEEIVNNKYLPIPYAKIETELPEGFSIVLMDEELIREYKEKGRSVRTILSIFSIGPKQRIKRRWRICANKRGVYSMGKVMIVASDIMSLNVFSRSISVEDSKLNRLTVLPKAIDLSEVQTFSAFTSGDILTQRSLLSDPLKYAGVREYTINDPMKLINWKSTASHGKLMVNYEERTTSARYTVILNMNSRENERSPLTPISPEDVEKCITVCASLFDRASSYDIPMRLLINTIEEFPSDCILPKGDIQENTLVTPFIKTKNDRISILYLLASLKIRISYSIEKLLEVLSDDPYTFGECGCLVIVSPYLSEDMKEFSEKMDLRGIKTVFFITTTNNTFIGANEKMDVRFENTSK